MSLRCNKLLFVQRLITNIVEGAIQREAFELGYNIPPGDLDPPATAPVALRHPAYHIVQPTVDSHLLLDADIAPIALAPPMSCSCDAPGTAAALLTGVSVQPFAHCSCPARAGVLLAALRPRGGVAAAMPARPAPTESDDAPAAAPGAEPRFVAAAHRGRALLRSTAAEALGGCDTLPEVRSAVAQASLPPIASVVVLRGTDSQANGDGLSLIHI